MQQYQLSCFSVAGPQHDQTRSPTDPATFSTFWLVEEALQSHGKGSNSIWVLLLDWQSARPSGYWVLLSFNAHCKYCIFSVVLSPPLHSFKLFESSAASLRQFSARRPPLMYFQWFQMPGACQSLQNTLCACTGKERHGIYQKSGRKLPQEVARELSQPTRVFEQVG